MLRARLRLVLISTLIVVGILILIGATYQGVATALERRRYPHPGQLVPVGDHQLHIYCVGEGSPIVVLEAPAASMSAAWGWVQPEVAKATRVCSYDRAGLGWSEAGDKPYDPGRVPEELRTLLTVTRQPPPYVLVGHSLGTSYVRRFAGLHPTDVAALVLVDGPNDIVRNAPFLTGSPWLARVGLLRATDLLADGWSGLPEPPRDVVRAFLNRPDHLTRAAREAVRQDDAARLGAETPLPRGVFTSTVIADLNTEGDARRITAAIVDTVQRIRKTKKAGA